MLFLKQRDVFITNDVWRVVLHLNTSVYEKLTSTFRGDMMLVHSQKK
jgi:hypothetical protein